MMLEARGLVCGYGDITVVRDVSLSVQPGQVLALLGRNGAGKTTTLKAISGLLRTDAGEVVIDAEPIGSLPPYKRVTRGLAFVQEGKRVFRQRTVEENLVLGAYTERLKSRALGERLQEAYGRFPVLRDKRHDAAGSLSGGQQQMLSIAQALMRRPGVLLLDEPSAGLAPAIVGEVYDTIAQLRDEGMAVLLVEQAVGWAASVADRIAVMSLGHKLYEGPATGAGAEAAIREIELGGDQAGPGGTAPTVSGRL
ncbi:ABC transporter ATP-binding protein [Nocardioides litoris]|uniref:ABC transporter ATP-binding protein n=1 Tax=Nocardioides litoris TaxID=1926648 RepID=UPI001120EFDA|nr:ABC transporter ATP-binding protein [Nocardioides litoris]